MPCNFRGMSGWLSVPSFPTWPLLFTHRHEDVAPLYQRFVNLTSLITNSTVRFLLGMQMCEGAHTDTTRRSL